MAVVAEMVRVTSTSPHEQRKLADGIQQNAEVIIMTCKGK